MLIIAFTWLTNIPSHIFPHQLNTCTTPKICQFCCPYPAKALWGLQSYSHCSSLSNMGYVLFWDEITYDSLPWLLTGQYITSYELHQSQHYTQEVSTAYQISSKSIPNFERWLVQNPIPHDLEWKSRPLKIKKKVEFNSTIIILSLNQTGSQMSKSFGAVGKTMVTVLK